VSETDFQIDLRGFEELAKSNEDFRRQIGRTVTRSLGRGLRKTAASIRRDLSGLPIVKGITRSTWGRKKENTLGTRVKWTRGGWDEEGAVAALGLYGYPAVLEDGGRFKAHQIPIPGKFIARRKGQRGRSRRAYIAHPGAAVAGHGFGGSNLRRDEGAILAQLDQDIGELLKSVYGF
jgi:hypothetical protein